MRLRDHESFKTLENHLGSVGAIVLLEAMKIEPETLRALESWLRLSPRPTDEKATKWNMLVDWLVDVSPAVYQRLITFMMVPGQLDALLAREELR